MYCLILIELSLFSEIFILMFQDLFRFIICGFNVNYIFQEFESELVRFFMILKNNNSKNLNIDENPIIKYYIKSLPLNF